MFGKSLPEGYKQTKVGVIPEEWDVVKLGDHTLKPDYGLTTSAVWERVGPKFIRITDIQDEGVDWSTVPHCHCSEREKEKYLLKKGDILIARIGATTGKAYVFSGDEDAVFASYLIRIKAKKDLFPSYLSQFTHSEPYWRQINAIKSGKLKEGINSPELQGIIIPFPPLPEQHRIATILSTVDAAIAATDEVIAKTEDLKRGLMQALLTKGIDEEGRVRSEETHVFCEKQGMQVPVEWDVIQLKDAISEKLQSGYSGPETDENDGLRALTLTAVTENRIDISNTKYIKADYEKVKNLFIRKNDIFIERSNTLQFVGLVALYEGDESFAIYPDILVRARAKSDLVLPKILFEIILHPRSRTYFQRSAKGTSGSMKKIDQKIIGNLYLPLPPLPEQHRIAAVLSTVDRDLAVERDHRAHLQTLKKGLMQDLLTGRTRVPLNGGGPRGV
ncbi:hypothetical protein RJ40_00920 [Methanofollis aquaemaris]|uniref:Type I restriction modification DNA specificity domain-containing protein n=1 Tax=Methanofollis aquaemaris TaxID=126734 RepID=A0A8A3S3C6_9EURY|nr:restriction endonuclease subunit S [Methanofollis aquaemaris]QSZ66160.1 hypothetical protein RJ40_00920 [Methanofollis aquaemaris]